MKVKYLFLILTVCIATTCAADRVDVFGCFAFQDLLIDLFSDAAKDYFWFPNCLPGGFWDKIQCSIGKCYCAYVDTGSQIPGTVENEKYENMNTKCPVMLSSDGDPCKEKQPNLPCTDPSSRYIYDSARGTCSRKTNVCYGFESYSACSRKCLNEKFDQCSFERDYGNSCQYQSSSTKYYHDPSTRKCRPYKYKGCGGNSNNYNSKWECLQQCENDEKVSTLITVDGTQYEAIIPKWLVLKEKFVPDVNNDVSVTKYKEIENFIRKLTTIRQKGFNKVGRPEHAKDGDTPEKVCGMKYKTGPCRALFYRWHYSENEGKCKQFVYGGCLPNANNFRNATHCEAYCDAENRLTPEDQIEAESHARSFQEQNQQQFESEGATVQFSFDRK